MTTHLFEFNPVEIDVLKYRFISIIKGFCPPVFRRAFLCVVYPLRFLLEGGGQFAPTLC